MKKILFPGSWFLSEETKLRRKKSFICAISNGQDSTFLFLFLFHLQKKGLLNFHLHYCQHFWQLQNFFSVEQITKLGFFSNLTVFITLPENKISTENQARLWRKNNMARVLVLEKIENLLLGHTFSDQNETILWYLIRGTSLKTFNLFDKKKILSIPIIESQFGLQRQPTQKKAKVLYHSVLCCQKYFFIQKYSKKTRLFLFKPPLNSLKTTSNNSSVQKKNCCLDFKKRIYENYVVLNNKNSFTSSFYSKIQQKKILVSLPLLSLSRSYILEIMVRYKVPLLTDTTNQTISFSRNKIRYQLLPLIRILFSKKFDFLLNNFLNLSKIEESETKKIIKNFQTVLKFQFFFNTNSSTYELNTKCLSRIATTRKKNSVLNKIFLNISPGMEKVLLKNLYRSYSDLILSFCNTENLYKVNKTNNKSTT